MSEAVRGLLTKVEARELHVMELQEFLLLHLDWKHQAFQAVRSERQHCANVCRKDSSNSVVRQEILRMRIHRICSMNQLHIFGLYMPLSFAVRSLGP